MEHWKRALVAQISEAVDAYLAGKATADELLDRAWGLMEAADLRMTRPWEDFYSIWARLDAANELLSEAWLPAGLGSIERVNKAAQELRSWASTAANDES